MMNFWHSAAADMRIEDNQLGSVSSQLTRIDQVSAGPQGAGTPNSIAGSGQDQIEISTIAGKISTELSSQAASRADRVSQLTALYGSGGYSVESAQVSGAMVSDALSGSVL
jgi:hypothetical protein